MTHDDHEIAVLYVVNALSPDEAHDFETHLADCVECQQEVTDMRSVTEKLSRSVQAEPPASLRAAVISGIAGVAQEPPASSRAGQPDRPRVIEAPATKARATDNEPAPASDNVVTLGPRRFGRVPSLVAAAAVLLALGFGTWGLQSHQDAQQANDRVTELISVLGAGDVRSASGSVPGGGSGTVYVSRSQGEALFVTTGMPSPPSGKVYELWTIAGRPAPAGTFTPGSGGSVVRLPAAALAAKQIAITVEPSGGSSQPTTKPVMSVDVPGSA
jgi:anti-sigma-K factor RskA